MAAGGYKVQRAGGPDFLERKSQPEFRGNFGRPKSYFISMAMAPQIFGRPGALKWIFHDEPDIYYKALIRLPDLKLLASISKKRMAEFTATSFEEFLKNEGKDAATLAEEDKDPEDEPGVPGINVVEHEVFQAAGLPVPGSATPDVHDDPPVDSKIPGMGRISIRFDNRSHESRHRRAFTTCSKHTECRMWVFLRNFGSDDRPEEQKAAAVAYLLAWHSDSVLFPYKWQKDGHIAHVPSDALVKHCKEQQFGAGAPKRSRN